MSDPIPQLPPAVVDLQKFRSRVANASLPVYGKTLDGRDVSAVAGQDHTPRYPGLRSALEKYKRASGTDKPLACTQLVRALQKSRLLARDLKKDYVVSVLTNPI